MRLSEKDRERYSRQILLPEIGAEGQRRLLDSAVVVIGCGATGCVVSTYLARAGVGSITLVDRDILELNNLQRQILFDEEDVGVPKAISAGNKLRKINSDIKVEAIAEDVNFSNVEEIIEGADLVLDGTDNMETRFLINDACIKKRIPWVYSGAIGTYSMTMNIIPDETACFRCFTPEVPSPGSLPTCDTVGVLNTIPGVVASIEATEGIKILLGRKDISRSLLIYDVWSHTFHSIQVTRSAECKCCGKHEYEFLEVTRREHITSLCGRNAVQITPVEKGSISFESVAEQLAQLGEVKYSEYTLIFKVPRYQLTLFPDGRAIIKGTSDEKIAKSLYARYIGT